MLLAGRRDRQPWPSQLRVRQRLPRRLRALAGARPGPRPAPGSLHRH
ncbi:hypothetical protein DB30_03435 [Enhygromyxa salina]|uniref:Uncharacterized protein n=1 Tax=Enhygromyxa salina TaxID=215803 RepID=A0A0C2CUF7_9BACT|nr:hypothetical protein DB30_03435 [Enhygromyxa salina]